uniref:Uncharacterized protein n=1 Tax=Arundo donax TaxID=35708 RepID=A0A0A8XVU7_ARUDO
MIQIRALKYCYFSAACAHTKKKDLKSVMFIHQK